MKISNSNYQLLQDSLDHAIAMMEKTRNKESELLKPNSEAFNFWDGCRAGYQGALSLIESENNKGEL